MNRRQKIIVSVVGIFIVLLALVELTYAYFLTQIRGNSNSNSITVSTANLILEYTDGNGMLQAANKLVPNTDVQFNKVKLDENGKPELDNDGNVVLELDEQGNPILVSEKTFSVENKGNEKIEDYAVIVDEYSLTYISSGKNSDNEDVVAGQKLHLSILIH